MNSFIGLVAVVALVALVIFGIASVVRSDSIRSKIAHEKNKAEIDKYLADVPKTTLTEQEMSDLHSLLWEFDNQKTLTTFVIKSTYTQGVFFVCARLCSLC
jgi:hypothetical protein